MFSTDNQFGDSKLKEIRGKYKWRKTTSKTQ